MRALWSVLILAGISFVHGCSGFNRVYEEADLPDEKMVIIKCSGSINCYVGSVSKQRFTEARLFPGNRNITAFRREDRAVSPFAGSEVQFPLVPLEAGHVYAVRFERATKTRLKRTWIEDVTTGAHVAGPRPPRRHFGLIKDDIPQ